MNRGEAHRLIGHNATAHDQVADSYERKHVEIFNSVEQKRLEATIAELLDMLPLSSTKIDVLDVGAGTGNLTLKFLAAGCRVCAADVSVRSLERLVAKAPAGSPLSISVIKDERLPIADATFDIVGAYSVLHHIPDYLLAVREMVRVLRPGGLLFIDHEASDRAWRDDPLLSEYHSLTCTPHAEHLWQLMRSGDAFTPAFIKTMFMKAFVNRRYEREGDLHVWPDDHIEWTQVVSVLYDAGAVPLRTQEYLLYRPRGGEVLYNRYRNCCTDM